MLYHSLVMQKVVIAGLSPEWPSPLDLELGMKEVLLLEGLGWEEGEAFWRVASSLDTPLEGEVLYWGRSVTHLLRPEVFRLRRQVAYISPGQVLLQHLTLQENITLAICYRRSLSVSQALKGQQGLLERLALTPYLSWKPHQLSHDVAWRGLWAGQLIQKPELILAFLDGPGLSMVNQSILLEVLTDYIARNQGAVFLAGRALDAFHPLAHRLLRVEAGHFVETHLLEHRERSPVDFFPLV